MSSALLSLTLSLSSACLVCCMPCCSRAALLRPFKLCCAVLQASDKAEHLSQASAIRLSEAGTICGSAPPRKRLLAQ